MAFDIGRRAVDLMAYLSEGASSIDVIFTGGEPLLYRSTMLRVCEYAKPRFSERGMNATFVLKTNGVLLNEELINVLADLSWKVIVSIDGSSASHDRNRRNSDGTDSYALVQRNLLRMLQAGVSLTAAMTVHPDECGNVLRNVERLIELGVLSIDVGPVYGTVKWNPEQAESFANALIDLADLTRAQQKLGKFVEIEPIRSNSSHTHDQLADSWGCHAGSDHLAFLPDGSICGCSALAMHAAEFRYLILGDVWQGIHSRALENFFDLSQASAGRRTGCAKCPASASCSGGCLAINLASNGRPLAAPEIYCKTIAMIPQAWARAWEPQPDRAMLGPCHHCSGAADLNPPDEVVFPDH